MLLAPKSTPPFPTPTRKDTVVVCVSDAYHPPNVGFTSVRVAYHSNEIIDSYTLVLLSAQQLSDSD